jgi:hypothetical protein
MKNLGGIKIIMIAALALMILAGTCAAVSLSNSGGGTWIMGTGGSALVVGQTSTINFDTLKTVDQQFPLYHTIFFFAMLIEISPYIKRTVCKIYA